MATTTHDRFEIKLVQLPGWAIPLAAATGVAIVALAGVVGLGILLLMSPIILGVGAVQALRHRWQNAPVAQSPWPQRPQSSPPRAPTVIDGDYEVVDNGQPRTNTNDVRNEK